MLHLIKIQLATYDWAPKNRQIWGFSMWSRAGQKWCDHYRDFSALSLSPEEFNLCYFINFLIQFENPRFFQNLIFSPCREKCIFRVASEKNCPISFLKLLLYSLINTVWIKKCFSDQSAPNWWDEFFLFLVNVVGQGWQNHVITAKN